MRTGLLVLAATAALAAAAPTAGANGLLQAGTIEPCVSPTDRHLIEGFHVSGLLANKGIVQASDNDRFQLALSGDVYGVQPPDDNFPPDPQLVGRLAPAAFAIEPLRQQGLRAGSTVELAPVDWILPPDDSRVWKQLLDQGQTLRVDVTATLALIDGAGQRHELDAVELTTTVTS